MNYELTDETIKYAGRTLHRIRALVDMPQQLLLAGDLGGFVEKVKNLQGNAWVFGDAKVFGDAVVSGDAWVFGNAAVFGNALVFGDAQVSGVARVYGNARVFGDAQVSGVARVYGNAKVSGVARVYGNAKVSGVARVYGNAAVYGDAWVSGNAEIYEPITQTIKEDPNDPFTAWLYEFEGYGMRIERLSEDLRDPLDKLIPWLRAAYEVGLNASK